MSDEIYIDGVRYMPESTAADLTGFLPVDIHEFCEDGVVASKKIGRKRYVSYESLQAFLQKQRRHLEDEHAAPSMVEDHNNPAPVAAAPAPVSAKSVPVASAVPLVRKHPVPIVPARRAPLLRSEHFAALALSAILLVGAYLYTFPAVRASLAHTIYRYGSALSQFGSAAVASLSYIDARSSGELTYTASGAASLTSPESTSGSQAGSVASTSTSTPQTPQTVVVSPIRERIVETYTNTVQSGIMQADLDAQIAALKKAFDSRLTFIESRPVNFSGPAQSTPVSGAAFALSQNIDQLENVTIRGATVSGVSGLSNADIPNDITADNYLPLTGGSIAGTLTVSGALTLPYLSATSTSATSTFSGGALFSRAPTIPHTFSTWATGASNTNLFDAALVINPASAVADSNLLSAAVNGSVKFLVDAEGDIFANNFTSVGSVTLSTTTASTFSVENNTTLGDSITDTTTINGTLTVAGTTSISSIVGRSGIGTTSPFAKLSVHANWDDSHSTLFAIASSTASATSTLFSISNTGAITTSGAITSSSNSYHTFNFASTTSLTASDTASTTRLVVSGLTANRVPYLSTAGLFTDSANLTFDGTLLTITGNLSATAATSTSLFARSLKANIASFGQSATSTFATDGSLTMGAALTLAQAAGAGTSMLLGTDGSRNVVSTSTPTAAYYLATSTSASSFPFASSTSLSSSAGAWFATTGGSVGIGTTSPSQLFSVGGNGYLTGGLGVGTLETTAGRLTLTGTSTALNYITSGLGAAAAPAFTFSGDTNTGIWSSGADTLNFTTGGSERMRITSTGNVGIAGTSPTTGMLEVTHNNATYYGLYINNSVGNSSLFVNQTGAAQAVVIQSSAGPNYPLNVVATNESFTGIANMNQVYAAGAGTWYFTYGQSDANGTPDAEYYITGAGNMSIDGTLSQNGADYAEYVRIPLGTESDDYPKGSVICLLTTDPDTYGFCSGAHDSRTVGVVSTEPGILGNAPAEDAQTTEERARTHIALAMLGRVPVKVSLEGGPIAIGDRLTSASQPGYAMKATKTSRTIGFAIDNYSVQTLDEKIQMYLQSELTFADVELAALSDIVRFASSTPEQVVALSTPFLDGFFTNLFAKVKQWLADASNGIEKLFVKELIATNVYSEKLCLGQTCITEGDLKHLLEGQSAAAASAVSPSSDSSSSSSDAATSTSDTEAPDITIQGANPAEISVGDVYSDLGATVTDNIDANLGIHTFVDGAEVQQIILNTSTSTTYTITYRATDTAGNTGEATRTVIVSDPVVEQGDVVEEPGESNEDLPTEEPTTDTATSSQGQMPPADEPQP